MDCFDPSELVFNRTYFAKKYIRTLKIKGDAHISSFSNVDVPPSSGCFNFSKNNLGFENRFILWRTEGPNLYLDEYSADHVLKDPSLCINFGHSIIIPGVKMFTHCGMLILYIPTQAAIHRIMVRIARDDVASSQRSILCCFPREEDLPLHWDCRHFTTTGTATKAEINMNSSGTAYLAFTFHEGLLVVMEFPFQQVPETLKETILQENRRLVNLIWRGVDGKSAIEDVASSVSGDDVLFFSVYLDGKLRVWSGLERKLLYTTDLPSLLTTPEKLIAQSYSIKLAAIDEDKPLVVVLAQMADEARFFFLRYIADQRPTFEVLIANTLGGKHVSDYLILPGKTDEESYILWTISRESFDPDRTDTTFQPYFLWRCPISMSMSASWECVKPAVEDQSLDELSFAFPKTLNAIKHRIFNGECYSFDVVTRALQVVCKRGPVLPQSYNDWSALVTYVDEYVSSGHFIQSHLNSEDKSSLYVLSVVNTTTSKAAVDKFYETLLRHCDEFQEAGLQPLGLWYSPSLDLIGVVQQCRFTIYHKGDVCMQQIFATAKDQRKLRECLEASRLFLKHDNRVNNFLSNQEQISLLADFIAHEEELCNVIRLFAEHCPIDEVKMTPTRGEYMESPFTTGFLSIVLRHRLLRRFKFANLIMGMTKLVVQLARHVGSIYIEYLRTLPLKDRNMSHDIWESVTRTHDSTILQTANNYRIMWSALSHRLTKQHKASDDGSRRLTVCQAFFQFGNDLVKRLNTLGSNLVSDDEDSSSSGSHSLPPVEAESDYGAFVREVIDGALVSLWPESTSLTLPYFLAEKGFAEALSKYCIDNEPFISELANAFRFYQGIAYSIQGDGVRAMDAFNEILEGVKNGDDALNIAICQLLKEPIHGRTRVHSLIEYYKLVMDLLRSYNLPEYSLTVGQKIIEEANSNEPLLPSVYLEIFKLYIAAEKFADALNMISRNPGSDERSMCLRELISQMMGKKKHREFIELNFGTLIHAVAEILERDCLATFMNWDDPIFQVTYSFYTLRHMYPSAARLYIEYSFRLSSEAQSKNLLEKRCGILAAAIGLVQMSEEEEVKFDLVGTVPEPPSRSNEPLIRQMYRMDMPSSQKRSEYKVILRKRKEPVEGTLIDLPFLRQEHLKAEARLALAQKYETYSVPPDDPEEIVSQSIKYKLYDMAFSMIVSYKLEPYELLEAVTFECLLMDHEEQELKNEVEFRLNKAGDVLGEVTKELRRAKVSLETEKPDWVLENRAFLTYTDDYTLKPYWMVLYGYLTFCLQINPGDSKLLRTVSYKSLEYSKPLPDWLLELHANHHLGDLLACFIEFDELEYAFETLDRFLADQMKDVQKNQENSALPVPFTVIDQLLAYAELEKRPDEIKERAQTTRTKVMNLMKLYSNMVKAAHLSF